MRTSYRAPSMRIERTEGVAVVWLGDGPNTFDAGWVGALEAALDEVEADGSAAGLVTAGAGRHYSNGFDLGFLGSLAGDELGAFVARSRRVLARILTFPLPTAAALNGHAFGIGAMLALAHDRRVMRADRGWWCLPEVDLGMQLHPFMTALVTGRLPGATAHEALLTGRRYTGPEAEAAGVVTGVAGADDLVAAAVTALAPFTGKQRAIVGALKADLYEGMTARLAD
jgi:Delta3-Delta2-enoyl-CoA isomerase